MKEPKIECSNQRKVEGMLQSEEALRLLEATVFPLTKSKSNKTGLLLVSEKTSFNSLGAGAINSLFAGETRAFFYSFFYIDSLESYQYY